MSKNEESFEVNGTVTQALANTRFRVQLETGGEVMAHVAEATGQHLDVVVATHEHADHLSGFVQKGSPFLTPGLTIGQVWLAWTEKRGDAQADQLRKKKGTAQAIIDKAVKEAQAELKARVEQVAGAPAGNSNAPSAGRLSQQPNEWSVPLGTGTGTGPPRPSHLSPGSLQPQQYSSNPPPASSNRTCACSSP